MSLLGCGSFSSGSSPEGSPELLQGSGTVIRGHIERDPSISRATAPASLFQSVSSAARHQPSNWARRAAALARATDYTSAVLQARHCTQDSSGTYGALATDDIFTGSDDGSTSFAGNGTFAGTSAGLGSPFSNHGNPVFQQSTTSRFQSEQGSDLTTSTYCIGDGSGEVPQRVSSSSGEFLTWSQILYLWQHDEEFIDSWSDSLRRCTFSDFFFETAPVNSELATQDPFEFILLDARGQLAKTPANPRLFLQHIFAGQDSNEVITFHNHNQKADMITPCQNGRAEEYAHLGTFLRSAPMEQVRNLWKTLGRRVEERLSIADGDPEPLWVSTNGVGVPWVHVRLDTSPRFYSYKQWKSVPGKARRHGSNSKVPGRHTMPSLATPAGTSPAGVELSSPFDSGITMSQDFPNRSPEWAGKLRQRGNSTTNRESAAIPQKASEGGGLLGGPDIPYGKHLHRHQRKLSKDTAETSQSQGSENGNGLTVGSHQRNLSSVSNSFDIQNSSEMSIMSGPVGSGSISMSLESADDLYAASVTSTTHMCGCFAGAARMFKRSRIKRTNRARRPSRSSDIHLAGPVAGTNASDGGWNMHAAMHDGIPSPIREIQLY